ncbi:trace amine-associated receptor 13c-like [Pygocentrus nattereri]|uniref:trace amine-associated receptor 13c-like n=1 Tax=Pygocentrus nattereri TaxID=42514 RepID=UPI0018919BEC|nr:trace amine-associated receptor 13c-like [Pygocentrus nattereri]
MDVRDYRQNITVQYCFPDINSSCRKELHTPTNLLILSLAVADLFVGLIVMPVNIMQLIDSCWYFGKMACTVYLLIGFVSTSASICSLIFIAVDQYIAVNDPLLYSTRSTVCKTSLLIILGWSLCLCYITMYLHFNDHLLQSQISTKCDGECVLVLKYSWVIIDLVVSFLTPCSIILVMYSVIFNVARRQTKAVRALKNAASHKHGVKVSNTSKTKAAKKLGIVIFVYLACWIPFYLSSFSVESVSSSSVVWTVFGWLQFFNSSVNPLIYAIFYSWFRKSLMYVVTCKIFQPSSSSFHSFPAHF